MNGQPTVIGLTSNVCRNGLWCWFEAHPGTAAWLQGIGTLIALIAAIGAYVRYRREGFRPRIQAWCNPDGGLAVLVLSNLGRASGEVDEIIVGRGRALKQGYDPRVRSHRGSKSPPCDVGPGESVRLLLTAGPLLFTEKSLRIAVVLGQDVRKKRVRRLRSGRISDDNFVDSGPQAQQLPLRQGPSAASAAWDTARRELSELANLYQSGHLSRIDLWVGRYRALRRAQRLGPPPNNADRSA